MERMSGRRLTYTELQLSRSGTIALFILAAGRKVRRFSHVSRQDLGLLTVVPMPSHLIRVDPASACSIIKHSTHEPQEADLSRGQE